MNDKSIEKLRYDKRANQELAKTRDNNPSKSELYLEQPNLFYYKLLREIKAGSIVLELGAGMGENTEIMLGRGLKVVASDISPASVKVMKTYALEIGILEKEWDDGVNKGVDKHYGSKFDEEKTEDCHKFVNSTVPNGEERVKKVIQTLY